MDGKNQGEEYMQVETSQKENYKHPDSLIKLNTL